MTGKSHTVEMKTIANMTHTKLTSEDNVVLYSVALDKVLQALTDYYCMPENMIMEKLMELEDTHGDIATVGIWGWLIHCESRKLQNHQIYPAISRDLGLRNYENTVLFTSDYEVTAKEYFFNNFINTVK
jgi:hypothetical protein